MILKKLLIISFLFLISENSFSAVYGQCKTGTKDTCASIQPLDATIGGDNCGMSGIAITCMWYNNRCVPNCLSCSDATSPDLCKGAFMSDPSLCDSLTGGCKWDGIHCVPDCRNSSLGSAKGTSQKTPAEIQMKRAPIVKQQIQRLPQSKQGILKKAPAKKTKL